MVNNFIGKIQYNVGPAFILKCINQSDIIYRAYVPENYGFQDTDFIDVGYIEFEIFENILIFKNYFIKDEYRNKRIISEVFAFVNKIEKYKISVQETNFFIKTIINSKYFEITKTDDGFGLYIVENNISVNSLDYRDLGPLQNYALFHDGII